MKKIIDRKKIVNALKQVDIAINERHVYDAITSTHPIRFCNYDNLAIEGSVSQGLEQTMELNNFFVFVHPCTNRVMGFFYALKIVNIGTVKTKIV